MYLGRGITTVQRWEQEKGLPVHRLSHAKKGSVFAFKRELDAWLLASEQVADGVSVFGKPAAPAQRPSRPFLLAAAVTIAALAVVGFMVRRAPDSGAGAVVSAASLHPRPLANTDAAEGSPSLSPDGSRVVYSRGGSAGGLLIAPASGGPARLLALPEDVTARRPHRPAWSPTGDSIAFLTVEGELSRALHVVSPGGGPPRYVTSLAGIGTCWSPDGREIGFTDRTSASEPFSVYALAVDGGSRRRLTAPPIGTFGDTHCAFSPDGRSLAVARYPTRHESHLHVVPLDAGDPAASEQRTETLNGITGFAWTPDGSAIVVGTSHGLWKVTASGPRTDPSLIAGFEAGAIAPAFSRPASGGVARLAYQHQVRDVNVWKWTREGAGGARIQKITDANWYDDFPALAPDGRRVVFASNRTSVNELWTADAGGVNARQITFHRGALVIAPQWSPDGMQIAFSSNAGGNRDIYVVAADGSRSDRVTAEPSEEENPSWSRDGRWIYFRSNRSGAPRLWKVPRGGGPATQVTSGPASQAFESPDGARVYFVRGVDIPGLWSIPVSGGPERLVIPDVREGFWAVAARGVAFIPSRLGNGDGTFDVRFFDFASENISDIARLRAPNFPIMPGFAVSADANTVLWTQIDRAEDDVMIVDRWVP